MPEHREDLARRAFLGHAAVLGAAAASGIKLPGGAVAPLESGCLLTPHYG